MNELLAKILEAHGGTDRSSRWRGSTLPTAMIAPPATSKQVTEQRPLRVCELLRRHGDRFARVSASVGDRLSKEKFAVVVARDEWTTTYWPKKASIIPKNRTGSGRQNGNRGTNRLEPDAVPFTMSTARRMRRAGRRCPDRLAESYQPRRGQPGKLQMPPGIRYKNGLSIPCNISSKETNDQGENYHEGNRCDGPGCGNGRDDAGGAARAAGSDKRRRRSG